MNTDIDPVDIERVCSLATASSGPRAVIAVLADPLDRSVWVRLASSRRAEEAHRALTDFGLSVTDTSDTRLHVRGWDLRLLRRRLGGLLAAVDDLTTEWDATAELASYYYDRRAEAGSEPELADVLADVESTMRRAVPIPHHTPYIDDVGSVLELITAAEDTYEQLICRHVDHAERVLTTRSASDSA